MGTEPIKGLIVREQEPNVGQLLAWLADQIDETVNIGSHVFDWCAEVMKEHKFRPALVLQRDFLEELDAISILVRSGSIEACKLILRALFEKSLTIEYICEMNTDNRLAAFMCCHLHKRIKDQEIGDLSSTSAAEFYAALKGDTLGSKIGIAVPPLDKISESIVGLKSILNRPEYQAAEAEYARLESIKEWPIRWHQFWSGPKSVRKLAKHLKHSGVYEILYGPWSEATHGTAIEGKIRANPNGEGSIIQAIRFPENAQEVVLFALSFALSVYPDLIRKFRPDKSNDLKAWYQNNLMAAYRKIGGKEQFIKVEGKPKPPDIPKMAMPS